LKITDAQILPSARKAIETLPEVESTEVDSGRLTAFPKPGKLPLGAINGLAEKQGWALEELELEAGRLDEVFRTITGGAAA
jgi:ABC-2 type transport system ATP-binding protein